MFFHPLHHISSSFHNEIKTVFADATSHSLFDQGALKISNLLAIKRYLTLQMLRNSVRAFTYQQRLSYDISMGFHDLRYLTTFVKNLICNSIFYILQLNIVYKIYCITDRGNIHNLEDLNIHKLCYENLKYHLKKN